MKTIRIIKSLAGPSVHFARGREYEVEDGLADAFCADGRAELVESETPKPKPARRRTSKARKGEGANAGPAGGAETR